MKPDDAIAPVESDGIASAVGFPLRSIRRLGSGQSARTEEVEQLPEGRRMVLRRHGAWAGEHDPEVASREAAVIHAVRRGGVPAPDVIWSGRISDRPALVTELMPGTVTLAPGDPEGWCRSLAETAKTIHAIAVDDDLRRLLRSAPPGPAEEIDEATVLGHPRGRDLLDRRLALVPERSVARTLVHGDYHPGNLLWRGGAISAVLDWEAARLGDPACDVAYCSVELRLLGRRDLAETFSSGYRRITSRTMPSLDYWIASALCRSIGDLEPIVGSWAGLGVDVPLDQARLRRERMIDAVLENR